MKDTTTRQLNSFLIFLPTPPLPVFTHPSPYRASLQPRRPCAHSPLVPQHQGYGQVLALLKFTPFPFCPISACPDLAIPPLTSCQASDTCATSLFRYSRKKKRNRFDNIILSHLPPPQPQTTPPKPRCAVNAILAFYVCLPGPTVSILCLRFWSDFTALPSCLPVFICLLFIYFLFLVLSHAWKNTYYTTHTYIYLRCTLTHT